jgi:uncharacterized protein (TIGR00251 family)
VNIAVRVLPRASREEIVGERDGKVVVRLTAPPVEGRANQALCRLLARRLGVAGGRVTVVRGARSRDKVVAVEGLPDAQVRELLRGDAKPASARRRRRRSRP